MVFIFIKYLSNQRYVPQVLSNAGGNYYTGMSIPRYQLAEGLTWSDASSCVVSDVSLTALTGDIDL